MNEVGFLVRASQPMPQSKKRGVGADASYLLVGLRFYPQRLLISRSHLPLKRSD